MQTVKSKKLMLLLISLAAVFALGVTTSLAQEKIKIKGKRFGTFKSEPIKVDDIEGHILSTGMGKGVDVISGSIFFSWSTADLVKGNGTHQGYGKTIDKDGDVRFDKFQGKVSTTMSPKGRPFYKGKFIGPGIFAYDTEGEYFIKK
jgi:hypothetical protein